MCSSQSDKLKHIGEGKVDIYWKCRFYESYVIPIGTEISLNMS